MVPELVPKLVLELVPKLVLELVSELESPVGFYFEAFQIVDKVWNNTTHSTFREHLIFPLLLFEVGVEFSLAEDFIVLGVTPPAALAKPTVLALLALAPIRAASVVKGAHHIYSCL